MPQSTMRNQSKLGAKLISLPTRERPSYMLSLFFLYYLCCVDGSRLTRSSRYNLRKRPAPSDAVINGGQYINLDGRRNSKRNCALKPVVTSQAAPPKPPPKELAFSCPVCMCSLVEATSTNCGHIFCKLCVQAALSAQSKCPTCRKELSMNDTIRVYLPATELS
ncbi:hypothetical protein MKW92_026592 [Papaver armeniacum]|nr:hypothetical protein MKW92_026592 [Papaver armeniacum]